jgi:hypothetical protein
MVEDIEDEAVLSQLKEDVASYASKKDIIDQLAPARLEELDNALEGAEKNETISWGDFKKEMKEWKKN